MTEPLIIIDVPNIAYRNWHAMNTVASFKMKAVYGVLRDLKTISDALQSSRFAFCFEGEGSLRKEIFPAYKQTRKIHPDKDSILREIDTIKHEILPMIGYKNIYGLEGAEADDCMALVIKNGIEPEEPGVMVTTDQDLYQWLDGEITTIWNPATKTLMSQDFVEKKTGVAIANWLEFKTMIGCKTDNIPGLPGIGEVTARKYLRWELSAERNKKIRELKEKFSDRLLMNERLMSLPMKEFELGMPIVSEDEINPDAWNLTVQKYGLNQLIGKCPITWRTQ